MVEFNDVNEVIKYYAIKLSEASSTISTNDHNTGTYKNELAGEMIQETFSIKNPLKVLCTYKNHRFYLWWLYGEILSELLNLDPPLMYKYKKELFSQHYKLLEDGRMQYMYGSRWAEFNQFVNVYKKLKSNPNTKRAVISIYTPYDTAPERNDAPCTTMYQFIHRDGVLNMAVFYRSWDFFGGFKTYDFGLSSFILQSFCSWLGMKPGKLCFYVNSLHYYKRDKQLMLDLISELCDDDSGMAKELSIFNNMDITTFYEKLRIIKSIEEAAYNKNFTYANFLLKSLSNELFINMASVFIEKNIKRE